MNHPLFLILQISDTSPVSRESGSSNAPISSEGNTSGENNSNQLPLWEMRLNQKWNYIIKQFYYENRRLYEPYEKQYAREYPGLPLDDSIKKNDEWM